MAKKIRSQDIFQEDLFARQQKSAREFIKTLDALQGELKEVLKVNKAIIDQSAKEIKTTETLKKRAEATKQVQNASKGLEQVEQQRQKTLQQIERTTQAKLRTEKQVRMEEERQVRAKKKKLQQMEKENSAYLKQSQRLTQLRKRYKDLAVQEKHNTAEGRKLLKTIQELDTKLKKIDKSVGQSQRNVGNYGSAWGKLKGKLMNVASAFGVVGGAMGAVQLIKSSFNVIADFDSAIANLGAISNATDDEMKELTDLALKLGESTKFTATEVAGLSLELAKLGFSTPEILDSTESILALASATGTELADASFIAGSTLRAFNMDASEMERVASTLGVATTKSALTMEWLQTAMSKVAPVSNALGFSIEDTTAMLGTLANAGFDASTGATATKNILLKLADSSGELAQALGRPVTNLDELVPALNELKAKGIDLAGALELTDKRSVSAFNTFLNGTETLTKLRDSITDVSDELQAMSDKQLDTINGQLALLNSKWQGMILGTSGSAGAVRKIKDAIAFLTNNLETILKVIYKVVQGLVVWKATQLALSLSLKAGKLIMKAWTFATNAQARATMLATAKTKALNTAIKSNPLGLLITALTTAVALLWEFGEATDYDAQAVDNLNNKLDKMREKASQDFEELQDQAKLRVAQIELEIAKLKEAGATKEKIAEKEKAIQEEFLNLQRQKIGDETKILNSLEDDILAFEKRRDVALAKQNKAQKEANRLRDEANKKIKKDPRYATGQVSISQTDGSQAQYAIVRAQRAIVDEMNAEIKAHKEALDLQQGKVDKAENELQIQKLQNETAEVSANINTTIVNIGKARVYNTRELVRLEKELQKLYENRLKLLNEIRKEQVNQRVIELDREINAEKEKLMKQAEDEIFVGGEGQNQGQLPDIQLFEALVTKKYDILIKAIDDQMLYEKQKVNQSVEDRNEQWAVDVINYQNKLEADRKNGDISRAKEKQLLKDYKQGISDLSIELEKNQQAEIKLIEEKALNDKKNLEKEKLDAVEKTNEEIIESANNTIDKITEGDIKAEKTEKDILQQRLQAYQEFTRAIIQLIDQQTDRKIDAINKELSASKKREDELRQLAIKGTTTAEQSLASEQKRQAELERQKAELEKKKLRRQAIVSGLELLSNKLDNDEPDAVGSTIRDITALIGILSTLPAFKEGSEYVTDGNAPKGRDKILARIDEGERILTRDQNRVIGDMSNEELTDMARNYKEGMFDDVNYLSPKVKNLHRPYQSNKQILSKFDELKQAIENKPMLTEIRWDEISKMIIEKVETKNTINRNHSSTKGIF